MPEGVSGMPGCLSYIVARDPADDDAIWITEVGDSQGIIGTEFERGAVAFFDLSHGLKLAVWPRASLCHDTGLPQQPPGSTDFSLAHNVTSCDEVDAVMAQAEQAGAQIVKRPQRAFWGGYAGYFLDPDGHLWEVVWNPQLLPSQDDV